MGKGHKWTNREDKILLNNVRKNPDNLSKAFINTARLLNRTTTACKQRWYNKYANIPIENIEAICFTTLSSKTMSINNKNSKKAKKYKTNKNLWDKIKGFLKGIL